MTTAATRAGRPAASRRGGVYIAVLGTAMLVTLAGLSALAAHQTRRERAALVADTVRARFGAQSVCDLVIHELAANSSWRTLYRNDTWTAETAVGEIAYSFKLVDEADGNLADDASEAARLYVRATVGEATRVYSVLLATETNPTLLGNILENGGIEDGQDPWTAYGTCTLTVSTYSPKAGSACLDVTGRTSQNAGPQQDVTDRLINGASYNCEVWYGTLKLLNYVEVALRVESTDGTQFYTIDKTFFGGNWHFVSGSFSPSWTGKLVSASWIVRTDADSYDFRIDEAKLELTSSSASKATSVEPVPGTWRREVMP